MTAPDVQGPVAVAPERTSLLRRVTTIVAIVVAPWGFVVTNVCYLLAIRNGGDDYTNAAALQLFAAHPTLVGWAPSPE